MALFLTLSPTNFSRERERETGIIIIGRQPSRGKEGEEGRGDFLSLHYESTV